MRKYLPIGLFALLCGCSASGGDIPASNQSSDMTNDLLPQAAPTALERLQQGDKTLCADKDTLVGVSEVLADLSRSKDAFQRMRDRGENLAFDFVSATGYSKDVAELSCSARLTMDGRLDSVISWKLRPNLSERGGVIIEAAFPDNDTASSFWAAMQDKYPSPEMQALEKSFQQSQEREAENAVSSQTTDPGEPTDTASQAENAPTYDYSNTT